MELRTPTRRESAAFLREMAERYDRNDVLTYASATARQLLIAVVPLLMLSFLLVGAFGQQDVWRHEIGPRFAKQASKPTYHAVDAVAEGLISSTHVGWLLAAVAILVWEISGAVRACMGGLNRIYELEESRSTAHRFALSGALAVPVGSLILGAMLVATRGGGWLHLGIAQPLWTLARWLLVVALLWSVVAVLIRYAPNGYQAKGWVTLGSSLVIVAWIAVSLVFAWWVFRVANYKTPFGTMIAILTLVGYLYTSSIVFLTGAQIDELARERAGS
jgi:membrane protein